MAILSDLRTELAAMLTAGGVESFDYIPERINPPVAVVSAGDPYVTDVFDVKTFSHDFLVTMEVALIADAADNDAVTDQLDDLICKTIIAVDGSWEVDVAQPFQLEANGVLYLATRATLKTSITIN